MTDMPPYLAVKDEDKNNGQGDCDESSDSDDSNLPLCFDKPRHNEPIKGSERVEHTWRVKEKYKTHCVALVLCLNIGVDPPDVVKTQPCARLECWIDPHSLSPTKALESIGQALQAQYERWQPRARYKQSLDPTSDEIKKLCCSLRRNAKDERVLFHYNGHGVPKPTAQGEIWVFNRAYTQYIPLSMYDLQTWMGAPSLYVYDCSNAGVILDNFKQFAEQHERDYEMQLKSLDGAPAPAAVSYRNCIQLAACAAGQSLPQHPALPADLFTACLTTPVHMHMKWFVLRNKHRLPKHLHELIDKIPGQVTDRRTMLGELNWIFTAITDTIAWSSLPPELFQQLFRADLLTASLCRNYLLADRVMRSYNCTPVCMPALPSLARHPLWAAWEHTLELALKQLPALLQPAPATSPPTPAPLYQHSTFFRDQLTAFHVWLELGKHDGVGATRRPPPEQLPMVLQVLLSTLHRLRALHILCRFLALGAWAVRAVLAVGIFPYMLKLLQASAPDLRATMLYIWANIISVDPSCQVDLVNAKGHKYFLSVLQDPTVDADHRTLAAYVLAGIVDNYKPGQEACLQGGMISLCLEQTLEQAGSPRLQQWASVALGRLWRGSSAARAAADRDLAHEKLALLLRHPAPETRAACAWALGTLIGAGGGGGRGEHTRAVDQQLGTVLCARLHADVALCARADLLAALQWLVLIFEQHFIAVYIQERMRRSDTSGVCGEEVDAGQDALAPARPRVAATPPLALPAIGSRSVYMKVWSTLCAMSREPHPYIAQLASDIIAYIHTQVDSVGRECEMSRSGSSSSLPPSPNTRSHVSDRVRRAKTGLPHTISEDSVSIRDRLDSTSSNSSIPKKPLVSTQFVQWSWEQFARDTSPPPCCPPGSPSPGTPASPGDDSESRDYHERAWRRARNKNIRREARGLRNARVSRLECQVFHARCPLPPAALHFHPYDQHVAVAYKDNLHIWDWGTGAKLRSGLVWTRTWGRVTSLLYLDTHARPLLAAASHRGDLAIYRPSQSGGGGGAGGGAGAGGGGGEGGLVSAWRALDVRPAHDYRPPPAQPIYSLAQLVTDQFASGEDKLANKNAKQDNRVPGATRGGGGSGGGGGGGGAYSSGPPPTLLAWSGARHSLAVAGRASTLKLWDLHAELLAADIHTGTDASVSALWRGGAACPLLACGFSDGSVRVWDERSPAPAASPAPAPAASPAPAPAPLLSAAMRPDLYILLVASMSGEVCIYDTRKMSPLVQLRAPGPLAAVDLHPRANVFACGSVNQSISMYELSGAPLNTIKFHEGFMGARIGPVSCLAFHPLRCALGVGARDSTVSVYSEARR